MSQLANQIFDILVREAGASEHDRGIFVSFLDTRGREFCFWGKLGFGGKFWNNGSDWYVTCYKEDETPARRKIIKKTNRALKVFQVGE